MMEKYTAFSEQEPGVIYQHGLYPTSFLEHVSAVEIDGVRFVKEPVRCRDCKHFTPQGTHKFENGKTNTDCCFYIRGFVLQITPDGFCAWGERREGTPKYSETTPKVAGE